MGINAAFQAHFATWTPVAICFRTDPAFLVAHHARRIFFIAGIAFFAVRSFGDGTVHAHIADIAPFVTCICTYPAFFAADLARRIFFIADLALFAMFAVVCCAIHAHIAVAAPVGTAAAMFTVAVFIVVVNISIAFSAAGTMYPGLKSTLHARMALCAPVRRTFSAVIAALTAKKA